MTGYITKDDPDEDGDTVSLRIPNKEIASIFQDSVVKFFTDTVSSDTIQNLIESMWDEEELLLEIYEFISLLPFAKKSLSTF